MARAGGVAGIERQDASLRHALRTARPGAAERIAPETDEGAAEMRQAVAKRGDLARTPKPLSSSTRSAQRTMDEMTGLIEGSALDTRVARMRDRWVG